MEFWQFALLAFIFFSIVVTILIIVGNFFFVYDQSLRKTILQGIAVVFIITCAFIFIKALGLPENRDTRGQYNPYNY